MAKNIQPIVHHKVFNDAALFAAVTDLYKEQGYTAINTLAGQKLAKVVLAKKTKTVIMVYRIA